MASTYTENTRLEKQGSGENDNTWGTKLNTVLDLLDDAIAGLSVINCAAGGTITLTSNNSASDEARQAILRLDSAPAAFNVQMPNVSKIYLIHNNSSYTATMKTSGATTTYDVAASARRLIYCDGSDNVRNFLTDYIASLNDLTTETSPAVADTVGIYDASAAANRKITLANLLKVITSLTAETAPATDDELVLYDLSGTTADKITLINLFKVVASFASESSPATDDELMLYDLSATTADKITLANLFKIINSFTADTSPDMAADYVVTYDASASAAKKVLLSAVSGGFANQLLHVRETQISGTAGGTFTSGADTARTLNTTVTNEISGASLAANQITLPAGTFYIEASAPAHQADLHRAWLYDTTGAANLVMGTSEQSSGSANTVTRSHVSGRFTLSTSSVLELRHRCSRTQASNGYGLASGFGGANEIYADIRIWKI